MACQAHHFQRKESQVVRDCLLQSSGRTYLMVGSHSQEGLSRFSFTWVHWGSQNREDTVGA